MRWRPPSGAGTPCPAGARPADRLDLGSGAASTCCCRRNASAGRKVYGLDMNDEMLGPGARESAETALPSRISEGTIERFHCLTPVDVII